MASVNRAILLGRVGHTPDIVTFKNGDKLAKFSLATSHRWRDRDGGDHEETQWHNVVVGGKAADIIENYVDKGQQIYVEGEINYRTYEDKGVKRTVTEIRCSNVQLLGGKQQDEQKNQRAKGREDSKPVEAYDNNNGEDDLPFGSSRARR